MNQSHPRGPAPPGVLPSARPARTLMRVAGRRTIADVPPRGKPDDPRGEARPEVSRPSAAQRRWVPLVALFVLAAALRAWTVAALARDLRIREPVLDGLYYLDLAGRLARGEGWPPGPIFMTPFYPAVLSLLIRTGLSGVLAVQVLQSILGLVSLGLLFVVVRRDLGAPAAWAAATLSLLCGPVLAMESQVLTESLLLLLATAALWLWPRSGDRPHRSLLFGMACGLLAMGRGIFLLLPPAAALSLWLRARSSRRTRPFRGALAATLGLAAGVWLALLPLAVRQTRTTGELRFLTLNGGLNLYLGNNPWARGLYSLPPGVNLQQDFTAVRSASFAAGRELSLPEADRFYTRSALDFLTAKTRRALWLLGRKALLYLSPHEIPQIEVFSLFRRDVVPLRVAFVDFRWILPLAALGLAVEWSRRRPRGARLEPYLVLAATGWVATVLFFATGRYRVPFLPAFLGLAGLGVSALFDMWKARRIPSVAAALPIVVAIQLVLPSYSRAHAEAFDSYQLGARLARDGRAEEALRAYRRAVELTPEDAPSWHGVGAALVRLGRLPEAVEAYRNALARMPDSAVSHYNLGVAYGRTGDDARALSELQEAVRLDPYETSFRSDLGVALARNNRREEAIRELRRVLERDPQHAPARRALEALGAAP